VVLHLGTATALFIFFWQEWIRIIRGFFRSVRTRSFKEDVDSKLAWLVIAGTVPAGLVGLLFERSLAANFARPLVAAIFLIINGALLLFGEHLRRQGRIKSDESKLSFWQAIVVGTSQVLALIPGISRSGVTVVGGLASGLRAEMAARFSFLLATPIILAAGVLEVPKLIEFGTPQTISIAIFGGVIAGIGAYLSTALLMLLFRKREVEALGPFGYYCIGVGIIAILLLLVT
jgi:undecaprenyl-diphosphatase